jgi:hypothetical protein
MTTPRGEQKVGMSPEDFFMLGLKICTAIHVSDPYEVRCRSRLVDLRSQAIVRSLRLFL